MITALTFSIIGETLGAGPAPTQVFGWGYNMSGAATGIPSADFPYLGSGFVRLSDLLLTNVKAIAAGGQHSLALRNDGTIMGWGLTNSGQARGNTNYHTGIVSINGEILTNIIAISAGFSHSLALRSDGTAVAWGDDGTGNATVPSGLSNIVAVSAGWNHSLFLKSDGSVASWPRPINLAWRSPSAGTNLNNIVAISATSFEEGNDIALKSDGTIVTWNNRLAEIYLIRGVSNVVAVASGTIELALTRDGAVYEIRPHSFTDVHSDEAKQRLGVSDIVAITMGGTRFLALKRDGTVAVIWGDNYPNLPSEPVNLRNVIGIAAGQNFCLALQNNSPVPITNALPELPKLSGKP